MNDTISIKKTGKQILVFLFFLFLIFLFLLKGKDVSQILKIAACASFPAIAAGIAMAGAFNLSEGLNLGILLKAMGHKVSFAQGMKYAYTGFFFSSITYAALRDEKGWNRPVPWLAGAFDGTCQLPGYGVLV